MVLFPEKFYYEAPNKKDRKMRHTVYIRSSTGRLRIVGISRDPLTAEYIRKLAESLRFKYFEVKRVSINGDMEVVRAEDFPMETDLIIAEKFPAPTKREMGLE